MELCKLAWDSTVYHFWMDGNAQIHNERIKTEKELIRVMMLVVCSCRRMLKNLFLDLFVVCGKALFSVFESSLG
jgi:hypothetical protein